MKLFYFSRTKNIAYSQSRNLRSKPK